MQAGKAALSLAERTPFPRGGTRFLSRKGRPSCEQMTYGREKAS